MALTRKLIEAGALRAARAATSPRNIAAASAVLPYLKTGFTGAVLGGATRGSTIDAVEDVAGLGVGPLVERIGSSMLMGIDFAVDRYAASAAVRADVARVVHDGLDARALERQLVRSGARRAAARGAISAAPAVIPGLGTGVELGAAVADQMVRLVAESSMVLGIAHLRGLDMTRTDLRRLDILLSLGIAAGAAELRDDVVAVGELEIPIADLHDGAIPRDAAVALGTAVAMGIVTSIARRRTAGVVLRLLPGGASVAAAAWYDWRATGEIGKCAIRYYDALDAARPAAHSA